MNNFDVIVRQYETGRKNPQHFEGLYIDIENEAKRAFALGIISDGFKYIVPTTNGGYFTFILHQNCTELFYTTPKGKESCIITKEASVKKEYHELYTLNDRTDDCIGRQMPKEMSDLFFDAKLIPGDIFRLGTQSFVCKEHVGVTYRIVPIYQGKITNAKIKNFVEQEVISLSTIDDYQELYNKVKNIGTASVDFYCRKIGMRSGDIIRTNTEKHF